MPYHLKKKPNEKLYWVVTTATGKKHSIDPIPLDRAKAQMRALYALTDKENVPEHAANMLSEHLRLVGVLRHLDPDALRREYIIQSDELKNYIEPIISEKPLRGIESAKHDAAVKKFETNNDIETIKTAVLAVNCRKIDRKRVEGYTDKEELLAYLRERECPALIQLEGHLGRIL